MRRFNWKQIKKKALYTINVCLYYTYIRKTLPQQPTKEDLDFHYLRIPKRGFPYGTLIERSGVKDIETLIAMSVNVFSLIIDKELEGGSIDIVEPNGVDREKLDLLRHINKDDDSWKDWDK